MSKYAVSIIWILDYRDGSQNIHNSLRILEASNEHEAFGLAFEDCKDVSKTHKMSFKTIVKITT